jgi:hypothetical protein
MRVKLLTSMAGDGFAYRYGEVADVSDEDAKRLIERGLAVPERPAPETTTRTAPERAVKRK